MNVKANAKINLSLDIKGKRADGYHLIDTVMQSISLCDELTVEKADTITVKCDKYAIPEEKNIAYKAAKIFFEDYGIKGGADITIKKNIPAPAGLGGGSADAAAVLLALNKLYSAGITDTELEKTALKLGADVPFFIKGGCSRAEGIGEVLTPVKPLSRGYILLAIAEQKPSTGDMYRIIDSKPYAKCNTEAVITALENNNLLLLCKNIGNAFTAVWEQSFVKTAMLNLEPLGVSLSGSGPTWFAVFENEDNAKAAKTVLESQNITCWLTKPQDKAIIFE